MDFEKPQVPSAGPLSILNEEDDWTGAAERLYYNGDFHLRKCFRIPIESLYFNIENGRYHTRFLLLKQANQAENIDPSQPRWRDEIIKLLNGTWEDQKTGVNTRSDRDHFNQLMEDIRIRGQERPGIVLENGGVMSGNRRLAALFALASEKNEPRFQRFEGFIVPGHMDAADRWRLEMSAQVGQGRLLREYEPVEKLLKMREGVKVFLQKNPQGGEEAAMKAVATEFGSSLDLIQLDLASLVYIEEWLSTTGHFNEWWRAAGLTEIFTEIPKLQDALDKNAVAFEDRSKIKRSVYQLISNGEADYRLIRQICTAVGTRRKRGHVSRGLPSAIEILKGDAPSQEELKRDPTNQTRLLAQERAERFKAEIEARKEERTPLVKAQAAESNLESVVEMLRSGYNLGDRKLELKHSVEQSIKLAQEAIKVIDSGAYS